MGIPNLRRLKLGVFGVQAALVWQRQIQRVYKFAVVIHHVANCLARYWQTDASARVSINRRALPAVKR
jgi:hypothetical protein